MIIPCQNMSLCLQLLSEPNNLPQPPCWSICFPIYSEDIQVMVAATATAVKNDCESFFFLFLQPYIWYPQKYRKFPKIFT